MEKSFIAVTFDHTIRELKENQYTNIALKNSKSLPSKKRLIEIIELINELIFPEFFCDSDIDKATIDFYLSGKLERLHQILANQIYKSLKFDHIASNEKESSEKKSLQFIETLPEISRLLWTDIQAIFDGDPSAKSKSEIVLCYPSVQAILNHRVAHELILLDIPYIPRMISEIGHSATGIDIHPGAKIGEYFFIDHGTGVVIGETCIIGNHVKIYQGVTLGTKKFQLDEKGNPLKNVPRHPILEDNITIYANATVLGRTKVGKNSVIGSNVRVTEDVEPNSKLTTSNTISNLYI
jgi:serine O-acetyltransferase